MQLGLGYHMQNNKVCPLTHTSSRGFPGGSVVKNPPASTGDRSNLWSGKIPHASGQLGQRTTTTEPAFWSPHAATTEATRPRAHALQKRSCLSEEPCTATREQPLFSTAREEHERPWRPSDSCSVMSDSATPWTVQSMDFSRPESWSG